MSLPSKPRFGAACNGCGVCCALEICPAGEIVYAGASAPCPGLKLTPDGNRTYCELVAMEKYAVGIGVVAAPLLQEALGIGFGCTMEDE